MERKELNHTEVRFNDIRMSEAERALARNHMDEAEGVIHLTLKVVAGIRYIVAAVRRVYARGFKARTEIIRKYGVVYRD